jgi:NitT/TauT family transport system permease protein
MRWVQASPAAFATPSEILIALPWFVFPNGGLGDLAATAHRTGWAFLLALTIGSPFGFAVAKSRRFRVEGAFVLDFLRSIPATALVPLFLVIFGLDDFSKIAVGAFSGSLAIAISIIIGFESLNQERMRTADRIHLRGLQRVFYYELPELTPSFFVGLRAAASLCLILVIVAEMFIGSEDGLGKVIMDRRYSDNVPGLYAAIVISGLLGYLINLALAAVAGRISARMSGARFGGTVATTGF